MTDDQSPKTIYNFDFSKPFTISDHAVIGRYIDCVEKGGGYSPELTQELYEVIDKFLDADMFSLDIREIPNVVAQFNAGLLKKYGGKS